MSIAIGVALCLFALVGVVVVVVSMIQSSIEKIGLSTVFAIVGCGLIAALDITSAVSLFDGGGTPTSAMALGVLLFVSVVLCAIICIVAYNEDTELSTLLWIIFALYSIVAILGGIWLVNREPAKTENFICADYCYCAKQQVEAETPRIRSRPGAS